MCFGLKSNIESTRGRPLCKAWGIWTNSPSLALALDGPHVICPGGCPSTPVSGRSTAHSGDYPDNFAIFVNTALSRAADDVRQMISKKTWPVKWGCSVGADAVSDNLKHASRRDSGLSGSGVAHNGAEGHTTRWRCSDIKPYIFTYGTFVSAVTRFARHGW